ncbi:MAG TPA: class I SAM-dependent methyltransferase [Anaeromyxobacter sp.]|nr:class I SAM-dependent methyltransferase [Anaeromyxobacter sp.]
MTPERMAAELFSGPSRAFAVRLWDGTELPPARDEGVRGRLVLRHPRALEAFLPPAAELRLAEAFLDGLVDVEGDLVGTIEAASRWDGPRPSLAALAPALALALRRALRRGRRREHEASLAGGRHSVERDRDAVRHHYDVSDDFYRLFLDERMVYSCAYFPRDGESLEDAQRAKLDLVCRKLALREGERLLDVGCGWGALVEHAGARYGVRALGVTVSANQAAAARERALRVRGGTVVIESADYRTLRADEPFDKVASVGMMEHVGRARLREYFRSVHRVLRPGGLFLNHAIADVSGGASQLRWAAPKGAGFIERYVFPDGELLPIAEVVAEAERAGFEVRDLESLREHYAETLSHWLRRLESRWDEAVAIAGERRARVYRLYLGASAAGFRVGRISVFQLLLAKRTPAGRAEGLPRCRADWYDGLREGPASRPVAGIVLAAGSARRMGRNKLLLHLGGESLVRRAVRTAREAGLDPVLVVVGHEGDRVAAELRGLDCAIVPNPRHALGMSTSLDAGIAEVPEGADAAVVILADMPLVDAPMARALVARWRKTGANLVASRYGGVPAPPTLYARPLFAELRGGEGEGRGREVVKRHAQDAAWVDWPASALADVDEAGDLERARAGLGEEAR